MGAHEELEHAEHAEHASHSNKGIALMIAVLALILAISEMAGKSAQTSALTLQIESSDLWNFFQAKNIRRTVTIVAADSAKIDQILASDEAHKAALAKQIDAWTKTAERYRSEPEANHGLGEGTVELSRRAQEKEKERDLQLNKYHYFEYASAALQIGIVLCSAAVITSAMALVWLAGATGLIGIAFMVMGFFFAHIHLLPGAH
jgi:ABC-type nickel/cobalt efflux system permease component RcnA